MPIIRTESDLEQLTTTVVGEFAAPLEALWEMWADPRRLERWWGPPGFPATVDEHELKPGGIVKYHMTGPDGTEHPGWWQVLAVDPPTRLEFRDGFADDAGEVSESGPVTVTNVDLEPCGSGCTRMTMIGRYASAESLQEVLDMGALEGMRQAADQIDALLAAQS
ncbi:SRPBCC family protein [Brevibacterium ihuae]|uniref:SRPBCC family protein n=1 Tax=Brevibacterium ihuae TaxID=1631743 RepID=UPI000C778E9B|nr:SRPBCC domain-containing protein [Brevibacterium ihuae]